MATLELSGITVAKDGHTILADIDLTVADGELMAIVGPSGSGKTTLLRVVGGLQAISGGELWIDGKRASRLAPHERNVAMVSQSDALYPFMNVRKNVSFPLEMRRQPRTEIEERVAAEGRALGLEDHMSSHPSELSAGYQQLVQIARAMVRAPDLFLLDEPLVRLDTALRVRMREELCMVQRGYGVTTLYVTNDPIEAMAVADRVAVMVAGSIVQVDSPMDVYRRPATRRAAEITGDLSVIEATVEDEADGFWLAATGLRHRMWAPSLADHVGGGVDLVLRPEDLVERFGGPLQATVDNVVPYGSHVEVTCRAGTANIAMRVPAYDGRRGDHIGLDILRCLVYDRMTGRLIA